MKRSFNTDCPAPSKKAKVNDFIAEISRNRAEAAENVLQFKFNRKRLRFLKDVHEVPADKSGIVYWMSRDQRVQDNWALLFSQKLALKNRWPLHVLFCVSNECTNTPLRQAKFTLDGLEEVAKELKALNINFHLLKGSHESQIPSFVEDYDIGCVVCDFSPLRTHRERTESVKAKLPAAVPLVQIDAHNVVPVWIASDKVEYSARTIRSKINGQLTEFLTEYPPVVIHPYDADGEVESVDWKAALDFVKPDSEVGEVDWLRAGYRNGITVLEAFIKERIVGNNDEHDLITYALSSLAPYFHFGQISTQRAAIEVARHVKTASESVEAFCDEVIVRRELSDNFCYFNENYNNFEGMPDWARKTLNDHRKDKREHLYTLDQFEAAQTHDDLWNSAQIQLIQEGKMHGFLRMYWAKKILEWTKTPEQALEFAFHLKNRYFLDGFNPSGFVKCMWSIGGLHDTAWTERAVFGKVRYMNYAGCKRKFGIDEYIAKYGGVVCGKKK